MTRQDLLAFAKGFKNGVGAGAILMLCAAGLAGWIMNIAAIQRDGGFNGATALRLIGIPFWPLGAILGWL